MEQISLHELFWNSPKLSVNIQGNVCVLLWGVVMLASAMLSANVTIQPGFLCFWVRPVVIHQTAENHSKQAGAWLHIIPRFTAT